MKIGEKAAKAYRDSCSEKMMSIRDHHQKEMARITNMMTLPVTINGKEEIYPVDGMARLNMHLRQIEDYGKQMVTAHIDAFIEVHQMIGECPHQEDVDEFIKEIVCISNSLINWVPGYYESAISPIPSQVVVKQRLSSFYREVKTIPGRLIPKLNKFISEAELRKERQLPIGSQAVSTHINAVNIFGNAEGGVQVGNQHSNQSVALNQQDQGLSEDQQYEAYAKISEYLKSKKIWKADWVSYKEIAEGTGLEVWVIKECIEYACFLSYLTIHTRQPDSVLLVARLGGI